VVKPDIFAKGGNDISLRNIPEVNTCSKIGCKVVMHVGGEIIHTDSYLFSKFKEQVFENPPKLRLNCPYCDDHPILREKCLYCKGTGKVVVDRA